MWVEAEGTWVREVGEGGVKKYGRVGLSEAECPRVSVTDR